MRHAEEWCKVAVDRFLREQGFSPEWHDGEEPPDYFVSIGQQKVAVEITSIHRSASPDGKDRKKTSTGITEDLLDFGGNIVREVVESGISIPGVYDLCLPPIPRIKQYRTQIVEALRAYFEEKVPQILKTTYTVILRVEGRDVEVWKWSEEGSVLNCGAFPAGGSVTHRDDQLKQLLRSAIQGKVGKLRGVTKPWWLVIHDQYLSQRRMEDWKTCLPAETSEFAAILRVQDQTAQFVCGHCQA
jgi:hypothetical protein